MKKFLLAFMSAALCLTTGCGSKNVEKASDIENTFESSVKVNYGGKQYECELSHTPEHVNIVKVIKPENLRGLTFSWENGVCDVSWHDLRCEFSKEILPENSFISEIVNVLNSVSSPDSLEACTQEGEYKSFEGKCDSGNFKILIDKKGSIKKISIPDKGIDAEFYAINA